MLLQDVINTSTSDIAVHQNINYSNISEILFSEEAFESHAQIPSIRSYVLHIICYVSAIANVIAIQIQYRIAKTKFLLWLHYFVANVLYTDIFLVNLSMFQIIYDKFAYQWCFYTDFIRPCFLSASAFTLVAGALYSYNLVVRGRCAYPTSFCNFSGHIIGFYTICSLPSLFLYLIQKSLGYKNKQCNPYFLYDLPNMQCSQQLYLLILLLFVYIIPVLLIVALFSQIILTMWGRSSSVCPDKSNSILISKFDLKYIKMSFFMCLTFIFANIPFIIQFNIILFIDSKMTSSNTALWVESLSVCHSCIQPFIFMIFMFDKTYFKVLIYKIRQWHYGRSANKHKNIEIFNSYKTKNSQINDGSFMILINKAHNLEAAKSALDK